ncbi:Nn.00g032100.m01.CDS01 [Neocucurbitaria sp. VM-36]
MPAPFQQSASSLKSLHLLRALLREASYLPDATARAYFRQYIVNRYKAYQPKQNATASFDVQAVDKFRHRSFKRRQVAIINERTRPLLRKGQKGLNFLRRANQGEIPCLQKVLFFAYGRLGRRKYTLLDSLLKPDPIMQDHVGPLPGDEGPAPLQKLYYSNKRYLQYFDAPKPTSKTHHTINISDRFSRLRAVIKSQYQKGISIRRELKSPAFVTSINNAWERPMPIKRARNNARRWYADTLTTLLPPLPNEEWDHLHAIIMREKHVDFAKRRKPGRMLNPESKNDDERFTTTAEEGLALHTPSRADKPAGMQRPHTINVKFMRRLYTKLLMLCCKLDYDHEHKRWKATWGAPMKAINPKIFTAPTDESLFAGVDAKGRIPRTPKKHDNVETGPAMQPRNAKGEYVRFPFFASYLPKTHPMRKELDRWKKKRAAAASESE